MIGIRYTIFDKEKNYKCGFLSCLEEYFDIDKVFELGWIFEDKLNYPNNMDMSDTVSYFTEKGNRAFHKIIKKCQAEYEKLGIDFHREVKELSEEDILYKDEYQIICLGNYGGSSLVG